MRRWGVVAMLATALLAGRPAAAGVYADDLGKCLVSSSSAEDNTTFVRWAFNTLSLNPKVRDLATVSATERTTTDRRMAELVNRLLLKDCRKQAVDALKYEGAESFGRSFGILGSAAFQSLTGDARVAAGISAYAAYLDKDGIRTLGREAGIADAGASK